MNRWSLLQARKYGVILIAGAAGIGMFVTEFQRIRALPPSILNYGYLSCFAIVGVLIFAWIMVTEYEIGLSVWLYPKRTRIPSGTIQTAQVMLIGLVLVALFYAARDALLFSASFAVYSSIICLLNFRMNTHEMPPLFADTREHLAENPEHWSQEIIKLRLDAVTELDSYFLGRPHTPRHIIILDAAFLACLIALYGQLKNSPVWSLVAYVLTFVTILVSELVIFYWRNARDSKLKPIDELLRGKGHDIGKVLTAA
ncbi:MAG: hypothetical protein NTY53_26590 [Kiritimatiellaeota bacterium]|nr:hypothetical protein [Kiritimatiellota bacterium]